MFNVGPFEMLVLAAVALIAFGPDRLPQLAKDAARMLRTLRDLAQGARSQLNDELGPEFADFDLRSLNPRTAIRNALLGDEELPNLNPREAISRALRGEDDPVKPSGQPAGAPREQKATGTPNQQDAAVPYQQDAPAVPYQQDVPAVPYQSDPTAVRYQPDPTAVPFDPDAT